MDYFEPWEFMDDLTRKLEPECKIQLRSKEGEPLRYKISSSPVNFVFLYFIDDNNEVKIGLDFSTYMDDGFDTYIFNTVKSVM